jgi:hypothetical protein
MIDTVLPVSQSFGARNVKVIAKTTTAKTGIGSSGTVSGGASRV